MRILIVEDEPKTGDYLHRGLSESGFIADLARTGPDGLHLALEHDYDLIVLDVMLPQMDGWTVLGKLRERKQTPVLFLTARDEIPDRVRGLELGADDYLVKPFDLDELFARVRALLRRGAGRTQPDIVHRRVTLRLATHEALLAGRALALSGREFALLAALLDPPGRVMSKALLEQKLYGWNEEVESNTVDVYVHRLRKKLGADFIKNVRGVGYLAPLEPLEPLA